MSNSPENNSCTAFLTKKKSCQGSVNDSKIAPSPHKRSKFGLVTCFIVYCQERMLLDKLASLQYILGKEIKSLKPVFKSHMSYLTQEATSFMALTFS